LPVAAFLLSAMNRPAAPNSRPLRLAGAVSLALLLAACGGGNDASAPEAQPQAAQPGVSEALASRIRAAAKYADHQEFHAWLDVPFTSSAAHGARSFNLTLHYPGAPLGLPMVYRVELISPQGVVVQRFIGQHTHQGEAATLPLTWAGRSGLRAGLYTARLTAMDLYPQELPAPEDLETQFDTLAANYVHGHGPVEQSWQFVVGATPKVAVPALRALAVGSSGDNEGRKRALAVANQVGSWPYTIHYGTLHGQTNDSDGGGEIGNCSSSQPAQSGRYGPDFAYPYAKGRGLDFLANTEHNHYFDGSSGTNTGGSAAAARSRYEAGVATANSHNLANPGFLALYGMEWGTIDGNGHLNIFNSTELYAWEYNASNELFGHVYVAKGDYAGLYTTMRSKGAIGQFNHPSTSNQFKVNNVSLGYTADGDEVMVLSEVMNTSAFSSNTTETETARSTYEGAFRILLERGFHVAPATNQDNHCANWGASYTNRTAVLIPTGTPLTKDSFLEALRARRVFATMDKHSQLVFSANDQIMGSRINNSGALNLNVGFHNPNGRSVAGVEIWAGVPGRNGTMTVLSTSATHSFTPAAGQHVFYAKLTQDDGKIIWSAPIWVTQGEGGGGGDSTPPTVSASVSGNSGTLTLSASASDNVGVSKVEFWIDGSLVGSLTNGPFTLSYDSRQLANGSHSLTAKAFDAAGNSATSSPVAFEVSNAQSSFTELEPNDGVSTANAPGAATSVTGFIGAAKDKDYFKLNLAANQRLRVDMVGPSGTDYDLYLVSSTGSGLARSEGMSSSESFTYQNGATPRTVYVKVQSYKGFSVNQAYTLSLSHP
jgi:hypothetical protein